MFYNLSQDWRWLSGFSRPSGCCFLRLTWVCSTTRWLPSRSRPTTSSSIAPVRVIQAEWTITNRSALNSRGYALFSSLFSVLQSELLFFALLCPVEHPSGVSSLRSQVGSFYVPLVLCLKCSENRSLIFFPCPGISVVFWSRLQGRLWAPQCWGGGEGEPPAGGAGEAQSVRAPGVQGEAPHLQVLHPAAGHPSGRIRRVQRPQIPLLQRHASKLAAGPQRWPPPSPPHRHRDHPLRPLRRSLAALDCRPREVRVQKRTLQKQKG